MKTTAEVIIVGGGVVGNAAAYYLAKRGVEVIVLEGSDSIGHGGSSRNGGGVRQSGRDVRELPYAIYGIKNIWPTLSEELGVDVEYVRKGNLLPGLSSGIVLVFIPAMANFFITDMLGGGKSINVGNVIQSQFSTSNNWPMGSAVSIVLMVISCIVILGCNKFVDVKAHARKGR